MKRIFALMLAVLMIMTLAGCNKQIVDTTYSFNYAIVGLPNGDVVEGKVQSWDDWEDSDMVQVTIDGKTYYTHATNIVLIDE